MPAFLAFFFFFFFDAALWSPLLATAAGSVEDERESFADPSNGLGELMAYPLYGFASKGNSVPSEEEVGETAIAWVAAGDGGVDEGEQ